MPYSNTGQPIFFERLVSPFIGCLGNELNAFTYIVEDRIISLLLHIYLGFIECGLNFNTVFIVVYHNIIIPVYHSTLYSFNTSLSHIMYFVRRGVSYSVNYGSS